MKCTFEEKEDVLKLSRPLYWLGNLLTVNNVVVNFGQDAISIRKQDKEKGIIVFMDFDPGKIFAEYDLDGKENVPVGIFYLDAFANLLGLFGDETEIELGKASAPVPDDIKDVEQTSAEALLVESANMDVTFLTTAIDKISQINNYNSDQINWWATGQMDDRIIGKLKKASSALADHKIVKIDAAKGGEEVNVSITEHQLSNAFTISTPMEIKSANEVSMISKDIFHSILNSTDQMAVRLGDIICEFKFGMNDACTTSVFVACQSGRSD